MVVCALSTRRKVKQPKTCNSESFYCKFYCKTFVESDMNYNLIVIPLSSKKDFTLPTVYLS